MEYPRAYQWNILGNMILYSIWAYPKNMHIRIPHVGEKAVKEEDMKRRLSGSIWMRGIPI